MRLGVDLSILNQKGTPAFYSDIFTNRPAAGFAGRVFISTDTGAIYEDTGSTWTLIADAGAGTTGTLEQVTTNGKTTTKGITISSGGLSTNTLYDTELTTGSVLFSGAGGLVSQDNTNLFWDNTNKYLGIGNTGGPTAPLDIHNGTVGQFIQLNATSTNNSNIAFLNGGTGKWRIGNVYNSGANNFNIYNIGLAANALSFNATNSNATFAANVSAVSFDGTATDGNYFLRNEDIEFRNHATSDSFRLVSRTTSTIAYIYFGPTGTAYFGYSGSQFVINDITYINGDLKVGSTTNVGTNKLQITGSSYFSSTVNIGTTAPVGAGLASIVGDAAAYNILAIKNTGVPGNFVYFMNPNGSQAGAIVNTSNITTAYTSASDYRIKTDLQDFNAFDKIKNIKVYDFKYTNNNKRSYGVMAHEIQEVLENSVIGDKDDINDDGTMKLQMVDYVSLVPILVKAIQELNDKLNRNNIN